jgi:hypothetical protein
MHFYNSYWMQDRSRGFHVARRKKFSHEFGGDVGALGILGPVSAYFGIPCGWSLARTDVLAGPRPFGLY